MAQLPPPAAVLPPPAAVPPIVAAPVLPPPVAAPLIEAATTYRQLLADQTRDAVHRQPGAYLAGYRFEGGIQPVPAPAVLRDQTVQLCDRQPMAFLCLVPRLDGTAVVRVLHRFMRYLELPGEVATGFHDRVLGLLGDVRPNQIPVVDIPANILHLATTGVRVPTVATMDDVVAAWAEGPTFWGPLSKAIPTPKWYALETYSCSLAAMRPCWFTVNMSRPVWPIANSRGHFKRTETWRPVETSWHGCVWRARVVVGEALKPTHPSS